MNISTFLRGVVAAAIVSSCTLALTAEPKLPSPQGWPVPPGAPRAITDGTFGPPIDGQAPVGEGAPRVFEHTRDAGPDQTFFAAGAGLAGAELYAWGVSAKTLAGQAWPLKVQFAKEGYLAATLPERCFDGPMLVWVKNARGYSRPMRLNVPEPWFCSPHPARPGQVVRIFGRDLARRPDRSTALVYLRKAGAETIEPLEVIAADKYCVSVRLPGYQTVPVEGSSAAFVAVKGPAAGDYELWVHAGIGGNFGWGEPIKLALAGHQPSGGTDATFAPEEKRPLQDAIDALARTGGGTLALPAGVLEIRGTLKIPGGVVVKGAGAKQTRIQLMIDPQARFAGPSNVGWNKPVNSIHTVGDTIEWRTKIPADGQYAVYLRYATHMAAYKMPGVSGKHTIQLDDAPPIYLENLPNTGSFGTFQWARCASIDARQGEHTLRWRNDKGGGIAIDAIVLSADPAFTPSDKPLPVSFDKTLVIQAEECSVFKSKDGTLPGGETAIVWLGGDGAGVRDLTLSGSPHSNTGILIASADPLKIIDGCTVEKVLVTDNEGKSGENSGVKIMNAARAVVRECTLTGRAPLLLFGAYRCEFSNNRLVSVTRFGGNAESAILSRCERLEECIFDGNLIACPAGAAAGGPTARRLLWVSTGRGSVFHNYIARNGVEVAAGPGASVGADQARFGGVAGTDQNVGEMILFEGNHRTMYFGAIEGGDARSITLPATIPPTPEERLGSVKREQLAYDDQKRESPFWPPGDFDETLEPPIHQYFVTIFAGPGQGQTRRVLQREGTKLILDRPWTVAPEKGSIVAVGTAFYRNLVERNHTPDGMTGIQLWISCMENVISCNTIARQRKPGVFLYAAGTTLGSSMPRTWNRGIAPLYFNHVEGTRTEQCSVGALVTSGDAPNLPIEFPRAMGNVLRHNSFHTSRTDGVLIASRSSKAGTDQSTSILGTVVEFNVVRDAQVGYHASAGADGTVIRRNHAYFWYPVAFPPAAPAASVATAGSAPQGPVGIQLDSTDTTTAIELNSIEGKHGDGEKAIVPLKTPTTAPVKK